MIAPARPRNTVVIGDLFTKEMVLAASRCKSTEEIKQKVVIPNMATINKATGQVNDPGYMTYLLEYVLSQLEDGCR